MSNKLPPKRPGASAKRILGDTRREATEAVHIAASKRRRLGGGLPQAGEDGVDDNDDEEFDASGAFGPRAVDSGALGDDDAAVFADAVYEEDDAEADMIYAAVEQRMQSRRQKQQHAKLEQRLKKEKEANPTVRQQFADLKSRLRDVSESEWATIPDIGDYSVKHAKHKKYTPAPDSLLERAREEHAGVAADATGGAAAATDLAAIGAGRTSVLGHNLDQARGGAASASRPDVDRAGYLAALSDLASPSSGGAIGDVKKARQLLKSVTSTNPTHAPGWIAAARLEEQSGKFSDARRIILAGCSSCPREATLWIEAARLHPTAIARRLLATGVRHAPRAVPLWLAAAELEKDDVPARRRVLRKAIEVVPRALPLWRAAVELEDAAGAASLLRHAVRVLPHELPLWLALVRVVEYDEAKAVLRDARTHVGAETGLWVAEAMLEETRFGADAPGIDAVMRDAVAQLPCEDAREKWLREAETAEKASYLGTARAIVTHSITLGFNWSQLATSDKQGETTGDAIATLQREAATFESRGAYEMARAIHGVLVARFPKHEPFWRAAADLEHRSGDPERMQRVLRAAVANVPALWLLLCERVWHAAGLFAARGIVEEAFSAGARHDGGVWAFAADIELQAGEVAKARAVLTEARKTLREARLWVKSAGVERMLGERRCEFRLLSEGVALFPRAWKLWLMLAQWHGRREGDGENRTDGGGEDARATDGEEHENEDVGGSAGDSGLRDAGEVYAAALEACRACAPLWLARARHEERSGHVSRARATLERGRVRIRGCGGGDATGGDDLDVLWRESVFLELRAGTRASADVVLQRAVADGANTKPKPGGSAAGGRRGGGGALLWATRLALAERKAQKMCAVDAIRACPHDARVMLEVAKHIWRTGRSDKTRAWLQRCVGLDASYGDAWATFVAFEREAAGNAAAAVGGGGGSGHDGKGHDGKDANVKAAWERVAECERRAVEAAPRYGDLWVGVRKGVGNERLSTREVLHGVVAVVDKQSDMGSLARRLLEQSPP